MILTSKTIWKAVSVSGACLTVLMLSVSCAMHDDATPATASGQTAATSRTEAQFESWRSMMEQIPKPEGSCLTATYPERAWRQVPCMNRPHDPLLPEQGGKGETVGDGKDFSAVVTGHVTFAQGGFGDVTGVKSEYVVKRKHHIENVYSLQLNTQFFHTKSCASFGSPDPQKCYGWEQLAYDTGRPVGLFIEYWLANFGPLGTPCPSGWHRYAVKTQNEVNCWINSALIPTPVEPITSLGQLRLVGAAAHGSRDQDFAELLVGYSTIYYVGGQNWFPDLDSRWQVAEFNILGDCCGDQATFNAGSTVDVRTEVDSGETKAPACDVEGFAAESNNLFLTGTSGKWPKTQYPSIVFTETNDSRQRATCATEGS